MQSSAMERRWILGGLFVAVLAAFAPVLWNGYVLLDDYELETNPVLLRGLSWAGVRWALLDVHNGNWHPLTWLTHMVDQELFGPAPWGAHLVSLLLHAASGLVLFLLLDESWGARWRSAAVSALFALHPLRVESVAWASERKDVLCTLFYLAACLAHVRWVRTRNTRWRSARLLATALALMSKPMAVTLPAALLLLDHWPLQRTRGPQAERWRALVADKGPLLALTAAIAGVTLAAQRWAGAVQTLEASPPEERVGNALVAYARYLGKTVWPDPLAAFYPLRAGPSTGSIALAGLLLLSVCLGVALMRRRPAVVVGWLWFLGVLFPVCGLVQVGSQAIADRYTYLPHVGFFLALMGLFPDRPVPWVRKAATGAVAGVLLALMALTARQCMLWKDPETLFLHTRAVEPENATAEVVLGTVRLSQKRLTEAETHFRSALTFAPGHTDALSHLASVLTQRGDYRQAEPLYNRLLKANPLDPFFLTQYGRLLVADRRFAEAVEHFTRALEANPWHVGAEVGLGVALGQSGREAEGLAHLARAVDQSPRSVEALTALGIGQARAGRFQQALTTFERAAALDPDYPGLAENLQFAREDARRPAP